jgi:protein-L-isoaspartate(D-aspartate) O-methyltransferase
MDFPKYLQARKGMVDGQLKTRDITDQRVLEAMRTIPREEFIPRELRDQAYQDGPLPIGQGQTISQPYIVALMSQLLELKGREKVLEIGTGSGYQAAILAKLAQEVYTIERHKKLLAKARKVFQKLRLENIKTKCGDGSKGWAEKTPFGAIIITAAAGEIPNRLIRQLAEGGRLVIPLGSGYWQRLVRITKKKVRLKEEDFGGCAFVPLIKKP